LEAKSFTGRGILDGKAAFEFLDNEGNQRITVSMIPGYHVPDLALPLF
jgi:hypothetical protein